MRTVDPDQELQNYRTFYTLNYVQYQAGTAGFTHPDIPDLSLVCSVGLNNMALFLGMGTINPNAKASHFGFQIYNPQQAWTDSTWTGYGGTDVLPEPAYVPRMRDADESIHLVYRFDALQPGEVLSFEYAHVVQHDELVPALEALSVLQLLQPTDSLSGGSALLSAAVNKQAASLIGTNHSIASCTFSVFAALAGDASPPVWHEAGEVSATSTDSKHDICSLHVDSTAFADGAAEVRVQVNLTNGASYSKGRAVTLRNTGLQLCFNASDTNSSYPFPQQSSVSLFLTDACTPPSPQYDLVGVSFFAEALVDGLLTSTLLDAYTAPAQDAVQRHFQVQVEVEVGSVFPTLPLGSAVSVRAAVQSQQVLPASPESVLTTTTTTVFSGIVVAEPTSTPTAVPSALPTTAASSVSAVCFLPSGNAIYGNSDCTDGEVQLLGRYVNLGIHNSGSFGTQAKLGRSYYDDRLGFLADFDKNGMDSKPSPSFAGDYFIPGLPLEGQRISHVPYLLCAFFYL